MKFTINRKEFAAALKLARQVANGKTRPIMGCVRLAAANGNVILMTGDGDLSIAQTLPADIDAGGMACVPVDRLSATIDSYGDDTIGIDANTEGITVTGETGSHTLYVLDANDYLVKSRTDTDREAFTASPGTMAALIDGTAYAVAPDSTRYAINGLLVEYGNDGVRCVATDGRRMAMAGSPGGVATSSMLLPPKAVKLLAAMRRGGETLTACDGGHQAIFRVGNVSLLTSLVNGKFPAYQDIIPADASKWQIATTDLLDAAKRVSTVVGKNDSGIKLAIVDGVCTVSASGLDVGQAKATVAAEGANGTTALVGLNPAYLIDALRHIGSDEVTLSIGDSDEPVKITAGATTCVIMPVSI